MQFYSVQNPKICTNHHIGQQFTFETVKDFHERARRFFPDIQSVLTRGSGAYVFAIAGKATLLPHGLIDQILELLIRFRIPINNRALFTEFPMLPFITPLLALREIENIRSLVHANHAIRRIDQEAPALAGKLNALNSRGGRDLLTHFKLDHGLHGLFRGRDGHHRDPAFGIPGKDMFPSLIISGHHLGFALVFRGRRTPRHAHRAGGHDSVRPIGQIDHHGRMLHGTDEHVVLASRMELDLQNGRREAELVIAFPREHVPYGHGIIGGGRDQPSARSRPRQRAHGMDVGREDLGDPAGQEVPNDHAPVIAAHGQERAESVEGARERHRDAVQRAVIFFRVILTKRL